MAPNKRKDEKEENQTENFDEVMKALLETPRKPKKTKPKTTTKKSKVYNTNKVAV